MSRSLGVLDEAAVRSRLAWGQQECTTRLVARGFDLHSYLLQQMEGTSRQRKRWS